MQTFLPYADFELTASILDRSRLGKQRVECYQILKILNNLNIKKGWVNHPAVKMWRGHRGVLKRYCQVMINEWVRRGYKNTIDLSMFADDETENPKWLGLDEFHKSHQSNLVRKQLTTKIKLDRDYISAFKVNGELSYVWPVS